MEALRLSPRGLSREEFIAGIGVSVLVHALVFAMVLVVPWVMPKKKFDMPYCTVNLVSMQELGMGAAASKKGVSAKAAEGPQNQEVQKSSRTPAAKSAPLVPVKRLRMEESPPPKPETELKKIEPREAPKIPDRAPSSAAVEKNLDKLITKPKAAPKPTPIIQRSSSSASEDDDKPSSTHEPAAKSTQTASGGDPKGAKGATGPQGSPKGTADGTAKGNSDGTAKGSSTGAPAGGSPNGAAVDSARRQYYQAIFNTIRRNWSLPEFLKAQKLEAHIVLVLRRDGKILDVHLDRRSGQPLFDQSVENAVRKSDPLPPFPEVYSPTKEEIGLLFRPEDLS